MIRISSSALQFPSVAIQQAAQQWRIRAERARWQSQVIFLSILAATVAAGVGVASVAASFEPLIAAVLVVAVLILVRFVTQPFYALLLTMIFIPMDRLDDYFPADLSAAKLLILVTIACFAIHWLVCAEDKRLLRGTQSKLILAFLATGLISSLMADYPAQGFDALFRFFRLFVLYLVVQNLADTPGRVRWLIIALLIAVSMSALYGLDSYLASPLKNFRAEGLTRQPNKLGFDAALMTPIAIALLSSTHSRLWRALLAAASGLLIVGVIISFSRGSAIALVACLPLLVWRLGSRNRVRILITLAVLAAIIVPLIPARFYDRFSTLGESDTDFSLMRRETYLLFAQRKLLEQPWIGIGLNNFEELYAQSEYRILLAEDELAKGRPAHNTYMHIAAETGLVGLGLFLSLVFVSWRDLRRSQVGFRLRGDMASYRLAQGLEISFLCFLVLCLFGSRQYEEFPWLIFALSGLLARFARTPHNPASTGAKDESIYALAAHAAAHPAGGASAPGLAHRA